MNNIQPKHSRILSITPSIKGFGFAVLEGEERLVNWGVTSVRGDKNNQCLAKVKEMIVHYQPAVMVLQDCSAKDSRRSPRIRKLSKRIIALGGRCNVRVALFSRKQVMKIFLPDGEGTKHTIAEIVAKRFPEELGFQLPPKRKLGHGENSRMDMFDAVALVLCFRENS